MHEPMESALSTRDRYYIAECTNSPVMHKNCYLKYLMLLTYLKQPLVFVKCELSKSCTLK